MPRTSYFSYPFIIIGGSRSFLYPGRGFISAFFKRLVCSTLWILMCGGSSSRYKCLIYFKILNGPVTCRLSLRLGWLVY